MDMAKPASQGAAPVEQESPDESGAQGQQGGAAEFIISIDQGLSKLLAMMQKAQVPMESVKAVQAAVDSFRQGVDIMSSGASGGGGKEPVQGAATMEQGGSSKAVPAY